MTGPEPGLEILPGLTLLRRLGRGGMGEAWLARDRERGMEVVAKLLPADSPAERLALLRREARLVRKLQHPRIVPVYGFYAGERFSAVTLRHMPGGDAGVRRGAAPIEVVRLARDVADALAYLHELGVVHRDVKLSNVLLDEAGRAHLADFGIAAVAQGDDEGIVLKGGGSRASMSPQQRAGEPAQPSDDLYALGVLLLELLCGRAPGVEDAADAEQAAGPLLAARSVPPRLAGLVTSLVAASPAARPRSAALVRDELDAIAEELGRAAAAAEARAVRLSPPPRAAEPPLVPTSVRPPVEQALARAERWRPASSTVLLGALILLAVASVVWLPRWATAPSVPAGTPLPPPETKAPVAPATAAEAPPAAEAPSRPEPAPEPPAPLVRPAPAERASRPPARTTTPAPREPAATAEASAPPAPAPAPTPDRQAEAQALAGHRDAGARLEAAEDWHAARQEYEQALAIDAHVAFALEGRERSMRRAALDDALDFHLRRPDRLPAAAVGREADELLERARRAQPQGPKLQARVAALEAALARARTKVAVVIASDGLTELTLSRVGALGTLTERRLELLPGTYTVTGTRRGYRDVRRQFEVAPGAPGPTVSLRCEEAIR